MKYKYLKLIYVMQHKKIEINLYNYLNNTRKKLTQYKEKQIICKIYKIKMQIKTCICHKKKI